MKMFFLNVIELKAIWRNNRLKNNFIFTGLYFIWDPIRYFVYDFNQNQVLLLISALFTSLFIIFTFLRLYTISLEGNYFDLFMTLPNMTTQYLKSKFMFFAGFAIFSFLLIIPTLFKDINILIYNFVTLLYNLGVNSYILLYSTIYNDKKLDLSNSSIFNTQGIVNVPMNLLLMIVCFGLPGLLFFLLSLFNLSSVGLLLLASLGIIGIFMNNYFLKKIGYKLESKKYFLVENFRKNLK